MRLLLDTHALVWSVAAPSSLDDHARALIADSRNDVVVSAASVWEISIKEAMGKLRLPEPIGHALAESRFSPLAITHEHASLAGALPLHHRDLLDRMLVAQAQIEGLTLVTRDASIARYGVATLPA